MAPHSSTLPGKSHGWRRLVGCRPWGREESDTTEQLHFQFSLSCIGEGNGNPLQCSCLENPRDGGAWWAAIYGVTQSRTRLKRLSSSSQSCFIKTSEFLPRDCNSNTRYYIISCIKSSAFTSNRIFFLLHNYHTIDTILNLRIILQYYPILKADNPFCAKVLSHLLISDSLRPHALQPTRLLCPQNSPGKKTGVGGQFPSPGDLLNQGLKPCLLHSRRVLYH